MSQPFLGMIQFFAFGFVPRYYSSCAGQTMPIAQNQALFALLGVTYGGNGTTTFALPDLRGRTPIGFGNTNVLGERQGTENVSLNINSMPNHNHLPTTVLMAASTTDAGVSDPGGAYPASTARVGNLYATAAGTNQFLGAAKVTVANAGSGVPFSTLSPYLALNCCIALQGLFPSRN